MHSRIVLPLALIAAVILGAGPASAQGAGAVSFTQTDKNVTQSDPNNVNPCSGASGTLTQTFNDVFHITTLTSGIGAGTFWATGTVEGTVKFVPNDASQPTYTGHFATWFGDNNNLRNGAETSTFSAQVTGSDGSRLNIHEVAHLSVSATGVTVSFDNFSCR